MNKIARPEPHQKLPTDWNEREVLRDKGQFWTPAWVAEAMVEYVLADGAETIFDPAVGEGAFFRAAKRYAQTQNRLLTLRGTEIDADALTQARESGLNDADLAGVQIRDFALNPPPEQFAALAANPPYIRHHRLSAEAKVHLKKFSAELLGKPLDGRAGFHIYFFLRALQKLEAGGRLTFILPADSCEGKFAPLLWNWITRNFCLDAVITFAPSASPFPGVDTNALVFCIRNAPPSESFQWAKVNRADANGLQDWIAAKMPMQENDALTAETRRIKEGITTGLSRPYRTKTFDELRLGDFFDVMRGIATGGNEFFFLTQAQAAELQLSEEWLRPAVGRTRDVECDVITLETLAELDCKGRPTLLFTPDGRPMSEFPPVIQDYLRIGEAKGLPQRALIQQRKPWYRMERRRVPPFLFAYLGRRNVRFIRNAAGVLPLTGFLCLYPRTEDPETLARLWRLLQRPETTANLARVGKSYGDGAIKVEPRALESLPLPAALVAEMGLESPRLILHEKVL